MLKDGAEILDLGAYSSRPGADHISLDEERERLIPALVEIRKEFDNAIISVDTFRSEIAQEAGDCGADIINDISGGMMDDKMYACVAKNKLAYVLMHMKGTPQNMQNDPKYDNVVSEVYSFFTERLQLAKNAGINDIILDPGFGFGKNLDDNYRLMKSLKEFKLLDCMVLTGVSRKSMINKVLDVKAGEALNGTTALNTIALLNGASILRVHDVKEAKEAIDIVSYYQKV